MKKQKLKIGDIVTWAPTGYKYKIIADNKTPIKVMIKGDVFPRKGFDFLICEPQKKDEFNPYHEAKAEDLTFIQ